MKTKCIAGVALGVAICFATALQSAAAAMVFEATRFDNRAGKRDLDVKVLVSERDVRVDVFVEGRMRVSLIESRDRWVIIDHVASRYAKHSVPPPKMSSAAPLSSAWLSASRRQFAMGGYCRVIDAPWSDGAHQERCMIESELVLKGEARPQVGSRAGEFLALIASTGDGAQLFDLAMRTVPQTVYEPLFPVLIRHFEQGQARAELRVVTATRSTLPRTTFDLPKGLQRVVARMPASQQASR